MIISFVLSFLMGGPCHAQPKPIPSPYKAIHLLEPGSRTLPNGQNSAQSIGFLVRQSSGLSQAIWFRSAVYSRPSERFDLSKYHTASDFEKLYDDIAFFVRTSITWGTIILYGEADPFIEQLLMAKLGEMIKTGEIIDSQNRKFSLGMFSFVVEVSTSAELAPGKNIAAMENQADYSMPMDLHKVLVFVDDSLRNSLQSYPQNNPACETKLIPPESEQDRIWRAIQDFSR